MTFYKRLATQGNVGYTAAPGTYATVMAIPTVWVLTHMHLPLPCYITVASILWIAAWYVVNRALPEFTATDPSEIVLDEALSFTFVFVGIVPSLMQLCIGFVLFRLFDIYKPLGIAYIEQIEGAWGIMLDDLFAAVLSCACLHLLIYKEIA
jgi:phosphatidylglycerophosphatase A